MTKFAKPVVRIVKKATDFIGKTPIAPILDKFTGGLYGTAKKVIDLIPDGTVKDNANKFADQAKKTADQAIGKVDEYQNKANQVIDKGKQWIDKGKQAVDIIKQSPMLSGARPAVVKPMANGRDYKALMNSPMMNRAKV
ncbi:MAG: hypothetical protein J6R47_04385, partial [Acholeplasmatales bacterium]|nr:hypothetical protein [Acholeplasmatales bacterium]